MARVNRKRRNRQNLQHGVKRGNFAARQVKPEDVVIMEEYLDHSAYGENSVLVVLDGKTGDRISMYTKALRISRSIPKFDNPSQLPDNDSYVQHFFALEPELTQEGERRELSDILQSAKEKASIAYDVPIEHVNGDALILGLLYYTKFDGDVPSVPEGVDYEMAEECGLPTPSARNMASPLEQKLNFIRELALTDEDFSMSLQESVNNAVKEAEATDALTVKTVKTSEDGFHGEPVS